MKRINEGASNFWTQDDFDMYTIDVDMTPDDETISLEDLEDYGIPYYDVEPEEDDVRDAIERWFEEECGSRAIEDFSFKINGDNVDIYDIRLTPDYKRDLMDDDIANTEHILSELNDELEIFNIILKEGYYAGIQTYVEPSVEDAIEDTAWNLFNTSYDYEDNAEGEAQALKDAEELVNKEIDKINKELLPQLKDYGWRKMGVAWGPADNGETGYRYEEGIKEGFGDEGFFTRDDLIEFENELEDRLGHQSKTRAYIDGNKLSVDYELDGEDYGAPAEVKIDMRKIKNPSKDLIKNYIEPIYQIIMKEYNELNEGKDVDLSRCETRVFRDSDDYDEKKWFYSTYGDKIDIIKTIRGKNYTKIWYKFKEEESLKEGKDEIKSFNYKDYAVEYSPSYNYYIIRKPEGEVVGYINGWKVATGNRKDLYKLIDKQQWEESVNEDTVKVRGKWVNKGKEGTHGEFKTKKEADAQRKAMFAGGFKEGMSRLPSRGQRVKLDNGEIVEVYTVYSNGIDYVGKYGRVFVENGKYEIIDS